MDESLMRKMGGCEVWEARGSRPFFFFGFVDVRMGRAQRRAALFPPRPPHARGCRVVCPTRAHIDPGQSACGARPGPPAHTPAPPVFYSAWRAKRHTPPRRRARAPVPGRPSSPRDPSATRGGEVSGPPVRPRCGKQRDGASAAHSTHAAEAKNGVRASNGERSSTFRRPHALRSKARPHPLWGMRSPHSHPPSHLAADDDDGGQHGPEGGQRRVGGCARIVTQQGGRALQAVHQLDDGLHGRHGLEVRER